MVKGDRLHGDLVASDQVAAAADENVEFQAATKEIFPWSHNAYFTNGSNASAVQSDAKRILDNDCRNLYTWNSGAPPSGFGAAYGAQLTLKSLIVKATCHGAYRQPLTVEDRSPGVRVVIGSGLSQDKVYQQALVWRNNAWQSVQLNGVGKDPDGYFTGGAWANLPFTASELNPGTRNFVAGYVCENGKCGCVDSACTSHAWQLQAFQR